MPDLAPNPTQPQTNKPKTGPVVAIVIAVLAVIGLVNSGDDEPVTGSTDQRPAVGAVVSAVVPDVVGMNHQLAQDTLQASGFYLLSEEDATGQGRMLLYDRNWVVVSQSVVAVAAANAPPSRYMELVPFRNCSAFHVEPLPLIAWTSEEDEKAASR